MSNPFGLSANELEEETDITTDCRYLFPLDKDFVSISEDECQYKAVIVDAETTGLEDDAEITKLSWIRFGFDEDMNISGIITKGTLKNEPSISIPEKIVKIIGITDEEVKGFRINESHLQDIFSGVEFIIAHNAAFDRKIIDYHFVKHDFSSAWFELIPWGCTSNDIDKDELEIATTSLASVMAQCYGMYFEHHDPEDDAWASFHIFKNNIDVITKKIFEPTYRLRAWNSEFKYKDDLKNNGYSWDPTAKVWFKDIPNDELDPELEWSKQFSKSPEALKLQPAERYKTR